jgi:hypothetical protein
LKAPYHAAISLPAGAALYVYTGSPVIALYSIISGIFLDIDHVPDFILQCGLKNRTPKQAWRAFLDSRLPELYLVLHSYELLFVLFLAGRLTGWNERILGLAAGALLHMTLDQFSNSFKYGLKPYFYFLTARALKKFKKEALTDAERENQGDIDSIPPM